ncbi:hypothetical protein ACTFIR_011973 [Dictyostelium discoideum]
MVSFSCIVYLNNKKDEIKFESVNRIFDVLKIIAEYISDNRVQYKTKDLSIFDKQPVGDGLGEKELDIETKLNENNIPTHIYVLYEPKKNILYEPKKDIFANALPPLGEKSGSMSNPSVGKNHQPATLVSKSFEILADIKPIPCYNLLWGSLGNGSYLPYSTESDIAFYVRTAVNDIIKSCAEMYGQEDVYGISTTYESWRVCWLPISDGSAQASKLELTNESTTTLQKPDTLTSTSNLQDSTKTNDNDILPPTPYKRILYGTKVYKYSDKQLPKVLYSVLMKMYYSRRKSEIPLLDVKRMYIQVVQSSWFWVNIKIKKLLYFIDTPLKLVKACVLLYDLKGGAHGRVWLCCASAGVLEGQVFVLKFSKCNASPENELIKECEKWRELWGLDAHVGTWNSKPALMMPYVSPASDNDWKNQDFIALVTSTIDKLSKMKFHHQDLKKCHVGKYLDSNNVIKVVFFDLVLFETNEDAQFIKESMLNQLFEK